MALVITGVSSWGNGSSKKAKEASAAYNMGETSSFKCAGTYAKVAGEENEWTVKWSNTRTMKTRKAMSFCVKTETNLGLASTL